MFGIGWVAVAAEPDLQATVAVALVWWLLIGGVFAAVLMSRAAGSDAEVLARRTWIPRIVWQAAWVALAVGCLWRGGRIVLGF